MKSSMWTPRTRLIVFMLITASLLNSADRQIVSILKPMLQEDLNWTDADYGHLAAVFQFSAAIALLGTGWLVDRIGWRRANPLGVGTINRAG